MTTSRIPKSSRTPALLAAALGLALFTSGCIIDDSGGQGPGCDPVLSVSYVILDNATQTAISCATAHADTVRITVNGRALDYVCDTGASVQTVVIPLDVVGYVDVDVELFGAGQSLSRVNQPMTNLYVGCYGYDIPDAAELPVVVL